MQNLWKMNPTTDELIKQFKEHDCKTNKEGHCIEGTILFSKLQGRLDVLENEVKFIFRILTEMDNQDYEFKDILENKLDELNEEIAKIKEVLK